jgi:acetyl esterase/lipase
MWYRKHENIDVFLVPADGSAPPVALTHTPEATDLIGWTPDSQAVIVSEDHDGDEYARLFRVEMDHPGVMQPLTEDRPPFFLRGGSMHPDGRRLFYGANYDFAAGQVIEPTWVYCHDLLTGERILLAKPLVGMYTVPELNKTGTHLIYSRRDRHAAGLQTYLVDIAGTLSGQSQSDREILNYGDRVKVFSDWHTDSENIVFLSESTGKGNQQHFSLGVYHWPTAQVRWLIDDPLRTIESKWVTPDGTIVVDEMFQARHVATQIDLQGGAEQPFPRLPGNLLPIGRALDGTWIGIYYSSVSPTELVRFTLDAQSPQELVSLTRAWDSTDLHPMDLAAATDYRWQSTDGLEIQGWLYKASSNRQRAIIYVHGGPTYHSEERLNPQIQFFVRSGFNVLDVNYRGSTGFGLKYRNAIKEDGWGGREQADITSGAQALIQSGFAAPGKVGVTGTSYGGYSSWWQITQTNPENIGAAAPICGMTDLVVDYETTRPDLRPYSEEMMGGKPDQVPERYAQRSPINYVQNIRGKLLIVQGARDPNVTPENVRQVRVRLDASRIEYELLVFEDEGHGIAKPVNQEVLYTRLAEFFSRALD